MIALVTGCAGFIGSHLTESLLADGHEVIGVDCFTPTYPAATKRRNLRIFLEDDGLSLLELDLAAPDEGDLSDVVERSDVVFHLAAQPGVRASWGTGFDPYVRNNVLGTQRVLEAVRHRSEPLERFVVASSSSVYGDALALPTPECARPRPRSPYGVTKLASEELVRAYHFNFGLPVVTLRYFTVYGPRQRPDMAFHRFIDASLTERPIPVFGDGRQTREFTFVADAVTATRAAATAEGVVGETFNVGSGSRASVLEVVELLSEFAGRQLAVEHDLDQPGDVRETAADCSRAEALLGFAPRVSLREGLHSEYQWLLAERAASSPNR